MLQTCKKAKETETLTQTTEMIEYKIMQVSEIVKSKPEILQISAREFAYSLYRLFTGKLTDIIEIIQIII